MPPKATNSAPSAGTKAQSPSPPAADKQNKQQGGEEATTEAAAAKAGKRPDFAIPKATPIANYKDDELTERQAFLLSKMANLKLYKPKELPPPRLNRNRGWLHVINEKYNIESALYMLEPWERYLLNTFLLLFVALFAWWSMWLWAASVQLWRDYSPQIFVTIESFLQRGAQQQK